MKKKNNEVLGYLAVTTSIILCVVLLSQKMSIASKLSDGFAVAGVLLLCTWTFKFVRAVGGPYGDEVRLQFQRETSVVPKNAEKLGGAALKNMYQYKSSPATVNLFLPMVFGALCIALSVLLIF